MSKGREPPTENPCRRRQRPAGAVPAGAGSAAALELCLSPPKALQSSSMPLSQTALTRQSAAGAAEPANHSSAGYSLLL